jgi:hypothetical protein
MDDERLLYPFEHRKPDHRQVKSYHSYYDDPIDHTPGRAAGYSRDAGGASALVQRAAIDELIASSERAGLPPREIAYVLAIASYESGFNPDAAAKSSSAYGLGQFTNDTLDDYGRSLPIDNLRTQADLLVANYQRDAALTRARGQGDEYIYKYYHNGSNTHDNTDTLPAIARKNIIPNLDRYEQFVHDHQRVFGIEPLGNSTVRRKHPGPHHDVAHQHNSGQFVHPASRPLTPTDGYRAAVSISSNRELNAQQNSSQAGLSTGDPDLDRLAAALFANDESAISQASCSDRPITERTSHGAAGARSSRCAAARRAAARSTAAEARSFIVALIVNNYLRNNDIREWVAVFGGGAENNIKLFLL